MQLLYVCLRYITKKVWEWESERLLKREKFRESDRRGDGEGLLLADSAP